MHIRTFMALVLLALSMPVAADFSTVTQAHEVALSDLRLPGNAHGTLGFRSCFDCESQTIRVNGDTRYVLNGRSVSLDKFKSALARNKRNRDAAVTVLHHLETNVITGVKVRLRQ